MRPDLESPRLLWVSLSGSPPSRVAGAPETEACMDRIALVALALTGCVPALAPAQESRPVLLKPARVFDGAAIKPHEGWVVLVRGMKIEAAGPESEVKAP